MLAPPPAPGSADQALDEEIDRANVALEATARWTQASKDANLNFPEAASIFSCSFGVEISEERTPRLHTLDSHKLKQGSGRRITDPHFKVPSPILLIDSEAGAHISAQLHKKLGTTQGQAPQTSCYQTLLSGSSGHQDQR